MIYVDRARVPEPDVLKKDADSKGAIETKNAIAWYKQNPKRKELFWI